MITLLQSSLKNKFKSSKTIFLLLILLGSSAQIYANNFSVKLEDTRIYVNGNERKGHLNLLNKGKVPIALSASIFDVTDNGEIGERSRDFLVTPPVLYIASGKRGILSVVRLKAELPNDRESLRYLRLQVLPGIRRLEENVSNITESLNVYLNIFYRPNQLINKNAVAENCPRLYVQKVTNNSILKNPSPYWMILTKVEIDGEERQLETKQSRFPRIAPFGSIGLYKDLDKTPKHEVRIRCREETGMSMETLISIK